MNCFYHENLGAVATCVDCGVGLCKDCVQNALYTRDNKPICLNCSKKEAGAQASNAKKARSGGLAYSLFIWLFSLQWGFMYITRQKIETQQGQL